MFSKLPELFGRNFATSYFIPIVVFLLASLVIFKDLTFFPFAISLSATDQIEILLGTTIISLFAWIGGFLLVSINRNIIRLMEGYGKYNPANFLMNLEKRYYRKLKRRISMLDEKYIIFLEKSQQPPSDLVIKRNKLLREFVERFPDEERWLLPTSFGNTVRAFEVYPRIMYGIDSIPAWEHLLAVIPEDYRKLIDDSKAQVDFWANVWILSILFVLEYIFITSHIHAINNLWILISAIALVFVAFSRARIAAVEWGKRVKAAFDVFLPELHKKLGFKNPKSEEETKQMWRGFSQAVIYMIPSSLPNRSYFETVEQDMDVIN